jgi:hypothetical protein
VNLSLYAQRPVESFQRTGARTAKDLEDAKRRAALLDELQDFSWHPGRAAAVPAAADQVVSPESVADAVKGEPIAKRSKVGEEEEEPAQVLRGGPAVQVRPFDPQGNFTGVYSFGKMVDMFVEHDMDPTELLNNRTVLGLDPGSRKAMAGVFVKDWERYGFFQVTSRDFSRKTWRDNIERSEKSARDDVLKEHGTEQAGNYRRAWKRSERASDSVHGEQINLESLLGKEANFVRKQYKARSKAQGKVRAKETKYLRSVRDRIQSKFDEMGGKKGIILLGADGGTGQGVRGTRGFFTQKIVAYLAQYFLILTLGEHNTTKLCPCCHEETDFANNWEIRSKMCASCLSEPTAGGVQFAFAYDRDFGAAVNLYYFAQFMVASGGWRPREFSTLKDQEKYDNALAKAREERDREDSRRKISQGVKTPVGFTSQ